MTSEAGSLAEPDAGSRDALAQLISLEGLEAGDRLPSERRLAQHLGVSRSKIREMLKVWESQGRILIRPGAGCFLRRNAAHFSENVLEVLGATMRVTDIFEVRRGLEITAVRLAAIRATDEDVRALRALLDRMQVLSGETHTEALSQFIQNDHAFHRAIQEATHNALYPVLFETLSPVFEKVSWKASRRSGARQHAVEYHRKIVGAIAQRHPDLGAAVMELHLSDAEELLTAALSEESDGGDHPGASELVRQKTSLAHD